MSGRWAAPRPHIGVAREATPLVVRLLERGMLSAFRHCCWGAEQGREGEQGGGDGLEDEVAGDRDGKNLSSMGRIGGEGKRGAAVF